MRMIRELGRSLGNLITWFKVIWQCRWWNYEYGVKLLELYLRTRLKYWYTKIHIVLQYLQKYKEANWYKENEALRKLLKACARLLPRLWD